MFTGIIRALGTVGKVEMAGESKSADLMRLTVTSPAGFSEGLSGGESVAVDGVCLTVVEAKNDELAFDVIQETLALTTLRNSKPGSKLNLERSLRFGEEVGGHILSGHISCTGEIVGLVSESGVHDLQLRVAGKWMRYILEKGFIAVDGISLTIGRTDTDSATFWLHLIPETLERTTLLGKALGDHLNIEFDSQTVATVDTVERMHGVSP
jgi:riboflavin synthase